MWYEINNSSYNKKNYKYFETVPQLFSTDRCIDRHKNLIFKQRALGQ